jgi:competence protein ComEC
MLTLSGALATAAAVADGEQKRILVLTICMFTLGVLRSPDYGVCSRPGCTADGGGAFSARFRYSTFPAVLRIRLPFLTGQCEEDVCASVEGVLVGDRNLLGTHVIARGLDPDMRGGRRELLVAGTMRLPQTARNPMAYDVRTMRRRQGVAGTLAVAEVLEAQCALPDRALAGMRRAVHYLIETVPEVRARGVLGAILLGRRDGLSPAVKSTMVKAGTYHVLAISGLHVGIFVCMISILVTVARVGRTQRALIGLVLVFSYVLFTGMRPSAMRAGVFFLVLSIARLYQHKVDYPNCVCAAGIILLLASPCLVWDLGFRLSLGAVLGMTLFLPQIGGIVPRNASRLMKALRGVEAGLLASLSAQVLTMPLVLWSFGRMSLIAGISNLIVVPVMSLALTAGVEGTLVAVILPGLGSVFMRSASVLTCLALRLAEVMVTATQPLVIPGRPSIAQAGVYYGAVLWLGLMDRRFGRRVKLGLLIAAFILMLVGSPWLSARRTGRLHATFLYVGDGDACVLELPDGTTLLVDTGPRARDYCAASSTIAPFLSLRGLGRIDKLVITHPHNDHYGGITALLDDLEVGEIIVSTTEGEEHYGAALETARRRGVPLTCVSAGERWKTAGVNFEVLHPEGPAPARGATARRSAGAKAGVASRLLSGEEVDPNAWSLVIKATYGRRSLLLTGDLTTAVQESLVCRGVDLACDILKVPHHGHPRGTSETFANALGAEFAIISCGSRYFSEPDSTTRILFRRAGMLPLSNRADGA